MVEEVVQGGKIRALIGYIKMDFYYYVKVFVRAFIVVISLGAITYLYGAREAGYFRYILAIICLAAMWTVLFGVLDKSWIVASAFLAIAIASIVAFIKIKPKDLGIAHPPQNED